MIVLKSTALQLTIQSKKYLSTIIIDRKKGKRALCAYAQSSFLLFLVDNYNDCNTIIAHSWYVNRSQDNCKAVDNITIKIF